MKKYLLVLLSLFACSLADAENRNAAKNDVALWYQAFDEKNPALLDRILSKDWVDIPPAPGQPAGPEGAKQILRELSAAFPDLRITMKEILQDGNKVVVRSEITGRQRETFMGFPAKNREMTIMAIDIHEFEDGKIVRTWHTEDWLTGLHQLGIFER
jgi:steroid delta-isomerase-like uncharacterized protein